MFEIVAGVIAALFTITVCVFVLGLIIIGVTSY